MLSSVTKFSVPLLRHYVLPQVTKSRNVFGIKKLVDQLVEQEKPDITLEQLKEEQHKDAVDMIKEFYLPEHVLVKDRHMDLNQDCALDEYLAMLLKQGNTLTAQSFEGGLLGICVGYACSAVDVTNLRAYAFYRQDPNTKDFLYFTAKLQETPNLWDTFKQEKIFEIKMLAVHPDFRRQGIATSLVEAAKKHAHDQGLNTTRMDCINPYDYKVAERCMLSCIVKFPLHRLRGSTAPFIKRSSPNNCCVRVYVGTRSQSDTPDLKTVRKKQKEMESLMEEN